MNGTQQHRQQQSTDCCPHTRPRAHAWSCVAMVPTLRPHGPHLRSRCQDHYVLQPRKDELSAILGGNDTHGKMNYNEAVFNAINVLLDMGVLSTPFALRSSGLPIGVSLFFFFMLVTNYTGKLLGYCLDYQEGMQTYPQIGHTLAAPLPSFTEDEQERQHCDLLLQLTVLTFLLIISTLWTTHLSLLSYQMTAEIFSS